MNIILPSYIKALIQPSIPLFTNNERTQLPSENGLYSFWWKSTDHALPTETLALFQGAEISEENAALEGVETIENENGILYRKLEASLKGSIPPPLIVDDHICLYVGTTGRAKGIKDRVREHIMINSTNRDAYLHYKHRGGDEPELHSYPQQGPSLILKRNSSSQLRAGLEYIFRTQESSFAYQRLKDSVYISYCTDAEHTFRDRFYAEDLAIGLFHPWFNLDGER